jgi:hypothetical protein
MEVRMSDGSDQVDGHAPLLEPAVLVSENCEPCRGTGYRVVRTGGSDAPWEGQDLTVPDVPNNTVPCEDCDSAGRQVREVPLSEFVQLAAQIGVGPRVPSPSELRGS